MEFSFHIWITLQAKLREGTVAFLNPFILYNPKGSLNHFNIGVFGILSSVYHLAKVEAHLKFGAAKKSNSPSNEGQPLLASEPWCDTFTVRMHLQYAL